MNIDWLTHHAREHRKDYFLKESFLKKLPTLSLPFSQQPQLRTNEFCNLNTVMQSPGKGNFVSYGDAELQSFNFPWQKISREKKTFSLSAHLKVKNSVINVITDTYIHFLSFRNRGGWEWDSICSCCHVSMVRIAALPQRKLKNLPKWKITKDLKQEKDVFCQVSTKRVRMSHIIQNASKWFRVVSSKFRTTGRESVIMNFYGFWNSKMITTMSKYFEAQRQKSVEFATHSEFNWRFTSP